MIDSARVAELEKAIISGVSLRQDEVNDLLAALDELERLRGLQKVVDRQQFADVLTKKELRAALYEWQTRAEKDEAELKRVRPLVEAVDGADPKVHWDTGVPTGFWDDDRDEIIRAALALKEGKK